MQRTIVRLFDNRSDAMEAAHELERMGIRDSDVSIVASNKDSWFGKEDSLTDRVKVDKNRDHDDRKDADSDGRDDRGEGAVKGAATGGLIGAGAGLLAGLGMLAIPGLGPVVAAGWLASTAAGAVAGAVAGGVLGGLVGALTDAGVPEEDAHVYSEGVRRGGTLLTVRADEDRAQEIERALDRFNTTDVRTRGDQYRSSGWSRFEADENRPN